MSHNYASGDLARQRLMAGVLAVNDAVKLTLGAKGRDGLLEALEQPHSIATNDGISIAERVKMDDPIENMGANLIKESISRANKQSGDGSTTTCVLTAAILEEGQKYHDSNEDIKQQLFDCLPIVQASIDDQTKHITADEVGKVATISAQSEEMGAMLQEIFQQIGKEGVIDWDNSYTPDTSYVIKDGVALKNTGYVANWMANANAKGDVSNPLEGDRVVMKNPKILIAKQKISAVSELEPYLKGLSQGGTKELLIMFDEMDALVLQALAMTYVQGIFKVVLLKAPTLWKDWIYEDFALMTGATIVEEGTAATWKTPSLTYLGTCEKIVAFRHETNVIGTKDMSEHIKRLEEASKKYPDYAARAAWLNSKSAIVKLGARSEVELTHKRAKLEDASNSCKNALQHGIVPGGGVCLYNCAQYMPDTVGGKILKEALQRPLRQIAANARMDADTMLVGGTKGIDVIKRASVDMFEAGIIDPAIVEKNAISAAISVAGTVLNCEVAIPLPANETGRY